MGARCFSGFFDPFAQGPSLGPESLPESEIVRVTHGLRFTNENEGENRSHDGTTSLCERNCTRKSLAQRRLKAILFQNPCCANDLTNWNRSHKEPPSLYELFSLARATHTGQALPVRGNLGAESGLASPKSGGRCQFDDRKHGAMSIWVPRLGSRLSN